MRTENKWHSTYDFQCVFQKIANILGPKRVNFDQSQDNTQVLKISVESLSLQSTRVLATACCDM
jgi:hypothetical protein